MNLRSGDFLKSTSPKLSVIYCMSTSSNVVHNGFKSILKVHSNS